MILSSDSIINASHIRHIRIYELNTKLSHTVWLQLYHLVGTGVYIQINERIWYQLNKI
jgi:hypothetical protein